MIERFDPPVRHARGEGQGVGLLHYGSGDERRREREREAGKRVPPVKSCLSALPVFPAGSSVESPVPPSEGSRRMTSDLPPSCSLSWNKKVSVFSLTNVMRRLSWAPPYTCLGAHHHQWRRRHHPHHRPSTAPAVQLYTSPTQHWCSQDVTVCIALSPWMVVQLSSRAWTWCSKAAVGDVRFDLV